MALPGSIDDPTLGLPPGQQPAAPWGWVPPAWDTSIPPPPIPPDAAAAPAMEPSPLDGQQPGIGVPSAALDAAMPALGPQPEGAPPVMAPAGPPPEGPPPPYGAGAEPPPQPPGAVPFGPLNVGEPSPFPPPIEPERLDTSPAAAGGLGAIPYEWNRDPLHAPDEVARQWAETATPQQIIERQGQLDEARRTRAILEQTRVDQENLRALQTDIEARRKADAVTQAKSDQIVADAIKLAKTKVDPDRWMSTRSVGQRIAAFLAAIIGGLVQGKTGAARNQGMDMIQQAIDQDIDAQKADIENGKYALGLRQNQVAQEFQRTGNLFVATETVRQATYQAAINKLAVEQQNYDAKGTRWMNYATAIQDMKARAATAQEAMRKTIFDETYKTATIDIQRQNASRELWKAKQDVALAWAKQNREGQAEQVWSPEQLGILNPGLPKPPIPMSQGDYAKWLGTQKEGEGYKATARANTPEERARKYGVGEVVDDKGQPVLFRDEAVAGKIADSKGAVDSATQLIDRIVAARERYGWSSDLLRSAEWRQMQADYGSLVLQKKNTDQLGVLSQSDMDLIGKSLGTTDPTEMRDPTAGLRRARENMVNNVNAQIRGQAVLPEGRSLQRWEPPPPPAPHRETPSETAAKEVLGNPLYDWDPKRLSSELDIDVEGLARKGLRTPEIDRIKVERYRELGGVLPSQKATIDGWVADLQSADIKTRSGALQHLTDAAERGQPGVQAYAQQALTNAVSTGIPESAPTTPPAREVTTETTPPKVYPPVRGP